MEIRPVGIVRSCFGGKFAVPRQPGLCPSAWGELVFEPEFRQAEALRGIEGFSHLWLVFGFHLTVDAGWKPTVRPPRLGGNERVGVFASRSTFRPNGLGLSLVRLDGVEWRSGEGGVLLLGGLDLVDGTPVYDVKPYLPYAEAVLDARGGFAPGEPERLDVSTAGVAGFDDLPERSRRLIGEALALDPRPPAAREEVGRVHGAGLCGLEVKFRVEGRRCEVVSVEPAEGSGLGA
ncbi:MAG: tRNA (N6-threonylcarbamoyladenosine(37)-N6)-methyltransferase TrmO [Verrucomicrobia bacterium]|nr:MAG: tRNA (N6-threonylcarbamoyladenosine(37)-N6)-methyltransferase TrmO [Verrucomicrobiota bacterium]TAE88967.1 MAG: tRNA (N6-threonylcarbamoyladenosine(37)-N6)-methyltransferase TrmO [Verrucomicrobiota bacterium]TAF27399.1 MAG: tRNA (N6-threonylcarbamoyladenosine(37)-N6)-methyltransferase TrmO [Verrucomicrobiota bacterium]TAF42487.1 MAG: tRNA (N6-threonylcarbamoyladenosine(37)-N6)-methyltransferase TrmO [Verrucomicrobiota bacterium]